MPAKRTSISIKAGDLNTQFLLYEHLDDREVQVLPVLPEAASFWKRLKVAARYVVGIPGWLETRISCDDAKKLLDLFRLHAVSLHEVQDD